MARTRADSPIDQLAVGETAGVGGARSEPTRRAILGAARRAFADRGYEHATIRAIASEAGIDPSMVMRYFGSKAGLFAAASTRDLAVLDLRSVAKSKRGEVIVRHFVERWEQDPGRDTLVFLLRSAVTNDAVAAQLRVNLDDLITRPLAALGVGDAERRGALIATQLLGLALCRYVLRLEPIASASAEQVIAQIAPVIQSRLDARA